jgi:excisionase family DNA binding protein
MSLKEPPDECRLRNKREAARYLGVSVGTVERMMRREGLRYVKLTAAGAVRFRHADLRDFVDARLQRAGAAAAIGDREEATR